jgi:hypothetical protein
VSLSIWEIINWVVVLLTFLDIETSVYYVHLTRLIAREDFIKLVYVWATGWTIGVLGFDSRRGLGIFLFITVSRTALGPTQLPIQWVPGSISLGIKRLGHEADHSPPSIAEVKECVELYLHSPNTPSWRGAYLKHRDNCTFNLYWIHSCMLQLFEIFLSLSLSLSQKADVTL